MVIRAAADAQPGRARSRLRILPGRGVTPSVRHPLIVLVSGAARFRGAFTVGIAGRVLPYYPLVQLFRRAQRWLRLPEHSLLLPCSPAAGTTMIRTMRSAPTSTKASPGTWPSLASGSAGQRRVAMGALQPMVGGANSVDFEDPDKGPPSSASRRSEHFSWKASSASPPAPNAARLPVPAWNTSGPLSLKHRRHVTGARNTPGPAYLLAGGVRAGGKSEGRARSSSPAECHERARWRRP